MEKRCPTCNRRYVEEDLNYCLADGSFLLSPDELPLSEQPTMRQSSVPTMILPSGESLDTSGPRPHPLTSPISYPVAGGKKSRAAIVVVAVFALIAIAAVLLLLLRVLSSTPSPGKANSNERTTANAAPTPEPTQEEDANAPSMPKNTEDAMLYVTLALKLSIEDGLEDVKIGVDNGVVTLTGTVNNAEAKKQAEKLVKEEKGVRSVINEIVVKGKS